MGPWRMERGTSRVGDGVGSISSVITKGWSLARTLERWLRGMGWCLSTRDDYSINAVWWVISSLGGLPCTRSGKAGGIRA